MKLSPLMGMNYFMVTNNREDAVPREDVKGTTRILYLTSCLWFDETAYKLLFHRALVWIMAMTLQFQVRTVTEQCYQNTGKWWELDIVGAWYPPRLTFLLIISSAPSDYPLACKLYKWESWTCNKNPQTCSFLLAFIFIFILLYPFLLRNKVSHVTCMYNYGNKSFCNFSRYGYFNNAMLIFSLELIQVKSLERPLLNCIKYSKLPVQQISNKSNK